MTQYAQMTFEEIAPDGLREQSESEYCAQYPKRAYCECGARSYGSYFCSQCAASEAREYYAGLEREFSQD